MNKKIQILRALAIIAVVCIHTVPRNDIGIVLRPFMNFSVALFIFLSEYLTKFPIKSIKEFYKKKNH